MDHHRNMPEGIVVMKFGGTSVKDFEAIRNVAKIVKERLHRCRMSLIAVVSAMSGVTDTLLKVAAASREDAVELVDQLRNRHLQTASKLCSGDRLVSLQNDLKRDFDSLSELLRCEGQLTPRKSDLIVSFGERLSSQIVAAALAQQLDGTEWGSQHVDARNVILTDNQYGKAAPIEVAIEEAATRELQPLIKNGKVPVMGGFIGSCDGVTTTLGRGGSDYTAALVGSALNAEAIEIWTDVNGIMSAHPSIVPQAVRVKTMSFREAAELAYFGAKVLHPATVWPAVKKNIDVFVLNSFNPTNEGTRVTTQRPRTQCTSSPFMSIAGKKNITMMNIMIKRQMLPAHLFLKMIFDVFAKYHCEIDMVSTSELSVSIAIDCSMDVLPDISNELSKFADVEIERNKALVCLVGEDIRCGQLCNQGCRKHTGICGQVFSAVSHLRVRMISLVACEINVSFMVGDENYEEAIRSLHEKFFTTPDETLFDVQ